VVILATDGLFDNLFDKVGRSWFKHFGLLPSMGTHWPERLRGLCAAWLGMSGTTWPSVPLTAQLRRGGFTPCVLVCVADEGVVARTCRRQRQDIVRIAQKCYESTVNVMALALAEVSLPPPNPTRPTMLHP
jgi:predicted Fe-S protein YdhL (DUF1289 family)